MTPADSRAMLPSATAPTLRHLAATLGWYAPLLVAMAAAGLPFWLHGA
ncbi:hypothetical protein [Cupriavidus agavae]|nr:hypothetical protein [Cupriavidus agavae]